MKDAVVKPEDQKKSLIEILEDAENSDLSGFLYLSDNILHKIMEHAEKKHEVRLDIL